MNQLRPVLEAICNEQQLQAQRNQYSFLVVNVLYPIIGPLPDNDP